MARQHLKKRKDGRYACRYKDQWFMGNTESEVLEAREAYKLQEKMGMRKDAAHTTVADYASQWLPVHKHGVDKKTYNDYAKQINALLDAIGSMNIQEVKPSDIQRVWLHYDGYSDSTIKRSHQLFFSMFDTACDDGYIRVNPMKSKHAHPPKGTIGTHRAITNDERQLILSNSQHFFHPVIMVMLYAGLRRGEALALDLDRDVDYNNHCIHVRQAVRYESNQPILDDPKTEAGTRSIPMLHILEETLQGHHGLLAPAQKSGGLMSESAFNSAWNGYIASIETAINGHQKRWHHRTKNDPLLHQLLALESDGKHKEAEELRLSDWISFNIRPHDLRHSYCTMLRDAGVDLKLAMKWMGHADEKMILKIYDHISDLRTAQAMNSVEDMLAGKQVGKTVGSSETDA